ncbi:GNAT family N-acetyltransferase [Bradyrhizobium liaoningense]|uniref:GNAT family N-acetyltransferase n=1 Tax=Bradyrhizobium liaoningense TaxID=43992 RepID=UPI001BA47451|nr:GNAT family N-acetyltransferase [Bradyrhizobium liaoningense]MBR0856965.1 GNAT family N-acetyltransferase [Bradyrhizobium liaoningense]
MSVSITFRWCSDLGIVTQAADLYVRNIRPEYISNEMQVGPANRWADDLSDAIHREMHEAVEHLRKTGHAKRKLALALQNEDLVACAIVEVFGDPISPYASLDDLVVESTKQDLGIGTKCLSWIESECRSSKVRQLFLVSGQGNSRAHRFFRRQGFAPASIVMVKRIQ